MSTELLHTLSGDTCDTCFSFPGLFTWSSVRRRRGDKQVSGRRRDSQVVFFAWWRLDPYFIGTSLLIWKTCIRVSRCYQCSKGRWSTCCFRVNRLVWNATFNKNCVLKKHKESLHWGVFAEPGFHLSRAATVAGFVWVWVCVCEKEVTGIPTWATFVIRAQRALCHQRSDAGSEETFVCFLLPVCNVTMKNADCSSESLEALAVQRCENDAFVVLFFFFFLVRCVSACVSAISVIAIFG